MSIERLQLAEEIAREAGELILGYWQSALKVGTKANLNDFVTEADKKAEELIIARLTKAFPKDGYIGEEGAWESGSSGYTWGVDPLDGTTNFIREIPHWNVSLGCIREERSVLGVVYDPIHQELFKAAEGGGAFINDRPLPKLDFPDLTQSLWCLNFTLDPADAQREKLADWLFRSTGSLRSCGSMALDMAWTAMGRYDAFLFECQLNPWDWAGAEILCTEQGLELVHSSQKTGKPYLLIAPKTWATQLEEALK